MKTFATAVAAFAFFAAQPALALEQSASVKVTKLLQSPSSWNGAALAYPNGQAEVTAMGRSEVRVALKSRQPVDREMKRAVTLAVVMPANDRMDGIVEKACELGAVAIQPLMSERSVLRLQGDRAEKKRAHWQGVAIAAAEQCGRSKPLQVAPVKTLAQWLADLPDDADEQRWLLSPVAAQPLSALAPEAGDAGRIVVLSGPEGGLSEAEEQSARARGFSAAKLGPRILRADTAPLAVLGWLSLSEA